VVFLKDKTLVVDSANQGFLRRIARQSSH